MFRSKARQVISGLIAATVIAAGSSLWAIDANASPNQPSVLNQGYAPISAEATSGLGVTLDPLTTTQQALALLPVDQVLSLAKARMGDLSTQASSITISLGSFTDRQYGNVDDAGVLHPVATGIPAFVVNFSGLSLPSDGGSTGTDSQQMVVINALTGEIIETLTYP